ncbi:AraC family transcriptional regulator [Corynebacterium sp. TAE3-ERU16]|uniref:AraC family transcriptional regulator n=1 Tax=Corynebacterium sp. TAE3-ERU16 TaxID=2849493 RepID=UPI001C46A61F|nr:AraC family transcriptional regulator [Corynebacterium sp. TAE3-ERU16]MBV7292948.1 AraC family transcriptional regulator [Corynebacterium sp. TAE3-ERU16]
MRNHHGRDHIKRISREVCDRYFPHDLIVRSPVLTENSRLAGRTFNAVTLIGLKWGAAVRIDTAHPGGYALNIPLRGTLTAYHRGGILRSGTNQGILCPPDTDISFPDWGSEVSMLGVRIDEGYLHHQAELAGIRCPETPVTVDLGSGVGRSWREFIGTLLPENTADGHLGQHPLVARHLSATIASGLVAVLAAAPADPQKNTCSDRRIMTAIDALESDPARPWTIAEIAATANVSVRTLQKHFKEATGVSPTEYLRNLRLDLVNDDLHATSWGSGVTVTDVAVSWGFTHMGRFSAAYRRRFGEPPSATIRSG